MFGLDAGTMIALGAMLIALFTAGIKYVDRVVQKRKESLVNFAKQSNVDVERDSIVVRGAEGALLLMEKTLKTASQECDKRISELEEENEDLRCQLSSVREDQSEQRTEIRRQRTEISELKQELKELTLRVKKNEG